jgi:predicted nucleic acid-binding protein
MRFWDSSAVIPLLLDEGRSTEVVRLFDADQLQTVWCLTEVEAASAISRKAREGMTLERENAARSQLRFLRERWAEVSSLEGVRMRALRLLSIHSLRAADALQLAAALVSCDEQTESLPFVCLDDRLAEAARKERFPVLP